MHTGQRSREGQFNRKELCDQREELESVIQEQRGCDGAGGMWEWARKI